MMIGGDHGTLDGVAASVIKKHDLRLIMNDAGVPVCVLYTCKGICENL